MRKTILAALAAAAVLSPALSGGAQAASGYNGPTGQGLSPQGIDANAAGRNGSYGVGRNGTGGDGSAAEVTVSGIRLPSGETVHPFR